MATNFEDIKIVSLNDKATYKSDPNTALMNVVFWICQLQRPTNGLTISTSAGALIFT